MRWLRQLCGGHGRCRDGEVRGDPEARAEAGAARRAHGPLHARAGAGRRGTPQVSALPPHSPSNHAHTSPPWHPPELDYPAPSSASRPPAALSSCRYIRSLLTFSVRSFTHTRRRRCASLLCCRSRTPRCPPSTSCPRQLGTGSTASSRRTATSGLATLRSAERPRQSSRRGSWHRRRIDDIWPPLINAGLSSWCRSTHERTGLSPPRPVSLRAVL